MPIDTRTGVLIIGVVFILGAVLVSVFIRFGKTAPVIAGTVPRVGLSLVGAALIIWVLVTRPTPVVQQHPTIITGGALSAPSAPGSSPATAASAAAGTPAPSADATSVPHTDVVLVAGAAFDSCPVPTAPTGLPDGATATRAQMLATQIRVKAFDAAIAAYTLCLNSAADGFNRQYGRSLSEPSTRAINALHGKLNNSAVDVDQALADKYNQQLRIFKARQDRSRP